MGLTRCYKTAVFYILYQHDTVCLWVPSALVTQHWQDIKVHLMYGFHITRVMRVLRC